jgi:glucokinase
MGGSDVLVGVDLGGTNVLAAVIKGSGRVLGESKAKVHAEVGASGLTEQIANTVMAALKRAGLKRRDVLGVGIGVPGPIQAETGIVVRCPNLGPSWDNFPLRQALGELLRLPVIVDNDVNVGAVGEYTYGAGKGARDMLAIFVGTGIGGGLILNGRLHSGCRDSAGEVGHMVILAEGPLCGCGGRGHAEALASRTAMERDIRAALQAGQTSIIPRLMEAQGRTVMSASVIGDAFEAGDTVAVQAVERAQCYLGLLVSACVNLLDPETIVLGGGVLERLGDAYLEPVRCVAQEHYVNKSDMDRVRIVRAALGDYSGALGAAVLARQRLS